MPKYSIATGVFWAYIFLCWKDGRIPYCDLSGNTLSVKENCRMALDARGKAMALHRDVQMSSRERGWLRDGEK